MLSPSYETVIGRHGLVSNGSLLWKVGVQIVQNYEEKFVDFYPHNPHRWRGETIQSSLLPPQDNFYTENTLQKQTGLSTHKIQRITDERVQFYPQSTPPTITTTIYINRRGTAA